MNVPSFESADPAFNSTLLNGTIVFSILKFVSMLATNALNYRSNRVERGQMRSNKDKSDLIQLLRITYKLWWSNNIWNIDFAFIFTYKGYQIDAIGIALSSREIIFSHDKVVSIVSNPVLVRNLLPTLFLERRDFLIRDSQAKLFNA